MSNDIDNVTPKGVLLVVSGPSGATIITSISLGGTTPVRSFQVIAKP